MINTYTTPQVGPGNAPRSIRSVNWLGRTLRRCGVPLVNLSEDAILKAATRQTGLTDWGAENFREPLAILLRSLDTEANLTLLGRLFFRSTCLQGVVNRLKIQADLVRHPEIRSVPIRRPLFIVGWPRTGTTLLHHLLSLDPNSRVLRLWELVTPSPPPRAETMHSDPRISALQRRLDRLQHLSPERSAIHSSNAQAPEECALLLRNGFASQFDVIADIPSFSHWLRSADMTEPYRYYHRQLQLLAWQTPGTHLVLKAPRHLWSLDAVCRVFPDACFVHTHRHPFKALPSACSLAALQRQLTMEQTDLEKLGTKIASMFAEGIEHALRFRATAAPRQFHDVPYERLVSDPFAAVRGIYEQFGYDLPRDMDLRIRRWLDEHPQNVHGIHRYTLKQFGLDESELQRRFANYLDCYPITVA